MTFGVSIKDTILVLIKLTNKTVSRLEFEVNIYFIDSLYFVIRLAL